jgi:hypothetical protein
MATDGGGGEVGGVTAMIERDIGPWFKPQNLDTFFVLANFYFAAILAISTYTKPNIWFQNGDI